VPLDWWPLTRDCLAYGVTVSLMICIIHDERVEWYEALTLVLLYIVYTAGTNQVAIQRVFPHTRRC
jgi:Ca2+/Na+ antiporter